jgi:hypothetical protein
MSRISEIQGKLLETNAAIAEVEKAIANDPKSLSLSAMMKSLEKRYEKLEADFMAEVDSLGVDVCAYRMFGEEEHPTLRALSSVLGDFQNLVSTVYDAIKTAVPKIRARISAEIAAETEFRFGYTFPGSVGVVLTIPNQRLLIGESYLDESLRVISEMARVHDSPEVLKYAKRLGPASIRSLYNWAYDHAESGLGVDMEWRRQQIIRTRLFAQRPELERLHQIINLTSEERVSELTVYANLVGVELTRRSFHLKLDTGEDIRGSLAEDIDISEKQTVELPRRYKAQIIKTEKIRYSTEQEDISYNLVNLERLP